MVQRSEERVLYEIVGVEEVPSPAGEPPVGPFAKRDEVTAQKQVPGIGIAALDAFQERGG